MPLLFDAHTGSRFGSWFDRTLLRQSLDTMTRATRIVAVSAATRDALAQLLGLDPARIDVVPNILRDEYRDDVAPAGGLPGGPRVLSVGRAAPYKNLEAVIETVARLPGATLVRVGEPLTDDQRALAARLGIEGRIHELGHLEPPALATVYRACDVLLQPSVYEGFGVPVIEAMACGLPVVTSDGGALAEVVGDAGMVVPLASERLAPGLADAVERVLSEPDTASMLKRRGLERAADFRPARVIPRLADTYRAAFEEHHA
jgi:glycosyltransferase involved in cell wall biosynthesis